MHIYFSQPEHEIYITRAREIRSEVWCNIFARIAGAPANVANRIADKTRRAFGDYRVAS